MDDAVAFPFHRTDWFPDSTCPDFLPALLPAIPSGVFKRPPLLPVALEFKVLTRA